MLIWTSYDKLTKEQKECAIHQYKYIRSVEEGVTEEEYMKMYSYTEQDIIDFLKAKAIEVDTENEVIYVEM